MAMRWPLLTVTSLLLICILTGCGKSPGLAMQHLDKRAPAAAGLPALPDQDQPTPLVERAPFGLYTQYPSTDTLKTLSTGLLSPDGKFRVAVTDQGVWVARIDAAWLWQVNVVPVPIAGAPNPKPNPDLNPVPPKSGTPVPPTPPQGTKAVGPVEWTPKGLILLRDDVGTLLEADPQTTRVSPLPASLQGKEAITFSPNGKQIFYYATVKTGRQLWLANADGTNPMLQAENRTGKWDINNKLVIAPLVEGSPKSPTP
jgi:hypothetical protein